MKYLLILLIFFNSSIFANDEIKIVYNSGLPPLKFTDKQQKANGLLIDIWKLWSKKTNTKISFIEASWDDTLKMVKNGKADIHAGLYYTKERDKYLDYSTQALFENKNYFFYNKDISNIHNNSDILPYVVGVGNGFPRVFMKNNYPNVVTKKFDKNTDLINAISKNEIKVVLSPFVNFVYSLKKNNIDISNFKYVEDKPVFTKKYFSAVKNGNVKLLKLINNGFKLITKEELKDIELKWTKNIKSNYVSKNNINFTKLEKEYLKTHHVIKIAVLKDWKPYDITDEYGEHIGYHADLLQLLSKISGINYQLVVYPTWKEAYNSTITGKTDAILGLSWSEEREEKYFNYSIPYTYTPYRLVVKKNNNTIKDIKSLKNKIAIIDKSIANSIIKKYNKNVTIVSVDTDEIAFKLIDKNKVEATLTNEISKNILKKYNLKIVQSIEDDASNIHMGVSKKLPILFTIIQKNFKKISIEEFNNLRNKWSYLNNEIDNKIEIKEIHLLDILPIKEIIVTLLIIIIISLILLKYLKKKKNLSISIVIWIFVSMTLIISAVATVIAINNLEKVQKQEIQHSLETISNITEKALYGWFNIQKNVFSFMLNNSNMLEQIDDLNKNKYNKLYLLNNQEKIHNYYKNIQNNLSTENSYFVVNKNYTVLSSSNRNMIGNTIKNKNIQNIITKAFKNRSTYLPPFKNSNNIFNKFYILTSIYEKNTNNIIAIFAIGINPENINKLSKQGRIGNSGETYIINKNAEFISSSRFNENVFLKLENKYKNSLTLSSSSALKHQKESNVEGYKDYRGIEVFGSWLWSENLNFAVITEIDKNEAMNSFFNLRNTIYSVVFLIITFTILLIIFIIWFTNKNKKELEIKNHELSNLTNTLEDIVEERTKELNNEKNFINSVLNGQENFVITSDGKHLKTANKAFFEFYNVKTTEEFIRKYGNCICDTFDNESPNEYIKKTMGNEKWLDYINSRPNEIHKTLIKKDNKNYIFTITSETLYFGDEILKTAIFTDITIMENAKKELEVIHKHTKDSIEYASLIQGALIPEQKLFDKHFKDSFVYWMPKDIVGGDIYLFEELRDADECLLMCIDCTGHGVPGAFVTMLVKAIERQIIAKIEHDKYHDIDISPAWILAYFNKQMKQLLKQDNQDSKSNAGFDGGIIYYNKKEQILKFSGAETPLFYTDENGEFITIKGSRHSVGYKKCNIDYKYKEHIIHVKEGMKFYITTDGYIDQNGGEKDFPFGKKRFLKILKNNISFDMTKQKDILINELLHYENMIENNDRNDDITVIGFEIKDDQIKTLLEYQGELTQNIISHNIELLENKINDINILSKLSTIVIELTQNMMNYSKSYSENDNKIAPAGFIKVVKDKKDRYYITSRNIISIDDKNKIEPILDEIKHMHKDEIKKRYKELRKSGRDKHEKGAGIGFFEIAKLSRDIDYKFKKINKNKYSFEFKVNVERRMKERN
jgi:ABC-type amino acid transport substrate-binding protein/serine phosphatase RsbU (regulator of sigma subunit)